VLKKLKNNRRGQAMVEFALVLPILLLLLCGIIDFGWLYYNQITLNNAAREGARYAVIHYYTATDWKDNARSIILGTAGVSGAVAAVSDPADQQITATVTADVPILTGFTSTILGENSKLLKASCTMRLEN